MPGDLYIGGGVYLSISAVPSYSNPGGTGDRRAIITVTSTTSLFHDPLTSLVQGDHTSELNYWIAGDPTDKWLKFNFGVAKWITEVKYYQSTSVEQGTWQWQGSDNDSDWTNVGAQFTLGGTTVETIDISSNTNYYTYYRILGISGTTSNGPWVYDFEFKLC